MQVSPPAEAVLSDHRTHPVGSFYDLARLGSMFRDQDIAALDPAYEELLRAGLVERMTGNVRFFGSFKPRFWLSAQGGRSAEVA